MTIRGAAKFARIALAQRSRYEVMRERTLEALSTLRNPKGGKVNCYRKQLALYEDMLATIDRHAAPMEPAE